MRGSQVHILQGEIVGCDVWMTYGTSDLLIARDRKVDPNSSKQRINLLAQIIVRSKNCFYFVQYRFKNCYDLLNTESHISIS